MSEPFLGQITCMANNFAPYGWLQCRGQILPIQQYAALFSLLGINYGGNGTTNFGLPNLQGNVPIGQGGGPGLTQRDMGEVGGSIDVPLDTTTVPSHNHTFLASAVNGTAAVPASGLMLAQGVVPGSGRTPGTPVPNFATTAVPVALAPETLPPYLGGGTPHNNMQPSLTLNWCIATQGVFPVRS